MWIFLNLKEPSANRSCMSDLAKPGQMNCETTMHSIGTDYVAWLGESKPFL